MSHCLSGCTDLGEHRASCPGRDCRGCKPRPSEFGRLCIPCHGRLTRDLWHAPSLVAYLRGMRGQQGQSGEAPVNGTREAPIPINSAAVDAADQVHSMLASWVMLVLEEHPGTLRGPDAHGSRITVPSRRRHGADQWFVACADCPHPGRRPTKKAAIVTAGEHYDVTRHVVTVYQVDDSELWTATSYPTAQVAGLLPLPGAEAATRGICQWLLAHQEWIERQEWVAEMLREVTGTVSTLRARFPQEEGTHHVDDVPCLRCGRMTLTYNPPIVEGGKFLVICDHHACSEVIPEEHWGLYVRRLVDELGERPKPKWVKKSIGTGHDGYGGAA